MEYRFPILINFCIQKQFYIQKSIQIFHFLYIDIEYYLKCFLIIFE